MAIWAPVALVGYNFPSPPCCRVLDTPPPPRLILSSPNLLSGVRCRQQHTDQLGAGLDISTCSNSGETSNHSGAMSTQERADHNYSHQLYTEMLNTSGAACTPLYCGSPHTVLSTLVEHFRWFYEHPEISKEALSFMLSMQKEILPTPNELLNWYEAAIYIIEPHIVSPQW